MQLIREQRLNITNVIVLESYHGFVFKTTFLNGKIYIGQTVGRVYQNQNGSMKQGNLGYFGSGKIMKNAVNKYGKESLVREILIFCSSQKALDKYEKVLTLKFKSTNFKIGYNIVKGSVLGQFGQLNHSCNPIVRAKISATMIKNKTSKGKNNGNYGKRYPLWTAGLNKTIESDSSGIRH